MASLLLFVLAGCPVQAPDSDPVPANDDDMTEELKLRGWEGVFALISFRCGCHGAAEQEGGLWDLTDEESAYDVLVGVPSLDLPTMNRVEPGLPDSSYMMLKIEDRHLEAGGLGSRMPPTGFALPDDDKQMLRDWIAEGATR